MLTQANLDDLSHGDRLQRELALTFARALHSHVCSECHALRICTVVDCAARKFPVTERDWVCFLCVERQVAYGHDEQWAADEVGGGGDQ